MMDFSGVYNGDNLPDYDVYSEDDPDIVCEDHDYMAVYCDRCGKYQGDECLHCGQWSDGGDYMASQESLWCKCQPGGME